MSCGSQQFLQWRSQVPRCCVSSQEARHLRELIIANAPNAALGYVVQNNLTVSQHGRMFLYHYQFYLCLINYQPIQKQLSSWVRVDWTKCNIALCSKTKTAKTNKAAGIAQQGLNVGGCNQTNLPSLSKEKSLPNKLLLIIVFFFDCLPGVPKKCPSVSCLPFLLMDIFCDTLYIMDRVLSY